MQCQHRNITRMKMTKREFIDYCMKNFRSFKGYRHEYRTLFNFLLVQAVMHNMIYKEAHKIATDATYFCKQDFSVIKVERLLHFLIEMDLIFILNKKYYVKLHRFKELWMEEKKAQEAKVAQESLGALSA